MRYVSAVRFWTFFPALWALNLLSDVTAWLAGLGPCRAAWKDFDAPGPPAVFVVAGRLFDDTLPRDACWALLVGNPNTESCFVTSNMNIRDYAPFVREAADRVAAELGDDSQNQFSLN